MKTEPRCEVRFQTGVRTELLHRLRHATMGWVAVIGLALAMAAVHSQTFTTIKHFGSLTNITGFNPVSALVQCQDGTLYGTTTSGQGSVAGTVFQIQPDGNGFTVLKWFTNFIEGANPNGSLTLSGTMLYGTTSGGGSSGAGTVFKLNTNGTGFTVLKNFGGNPDGNPQARLTLSDSVIYGTTFGSWFQGFRFVGGTVFKMNTDGTGYVVLKFFPGYPVTSPVILSSGVLYGTTYGTTSGTVFRMNTDGTGFTVLKNFSGSDEGSPSELTLSAGVLYGSTPGGGSSGNGTVFQLNTDGTGFTVLKNFTGSDGSGPNPLAMSGGVLYGTTAGGGDLGLGTVFKIDLTGPTLLSLKPQNNSLVLGWINPTWALQSAPQVTGTYTNVPGATSPYTNAVTDAQMFFRLIGI